MPTIKTTTLHCTPLGVVEVITQERPRGFATFIKASDYEGVYGSYHQTKELAIEEHKRRVRQIEGSPSPRNARQR